MRGMDFEETESGVKRALRRFTEGADDFGYAFGRERHGHGIVGRKGDGARRDDIAPAAIVRRKLAGSIPGTSRARLASCVGKLDAGYAALGVNEFCNAGERLDVRFAPNSQILRADASLGQNSASFGHNQRRTAGCAASQVNEMPIGGQTVFAGVLAHGRDSDAIGKADIADLELIEKSVCSSRYRHPSALLAFLRWFKKADSDPLRLRADSQIIKSRFRGTD